MGRMKELVIEAEDLTIETGRRHTVYLTEDEVHILDDDEYDEWLAMLEMKAAAERDRMAEVESARIAQSWTDEDAWMQAEEAA